MTQLKTFRDPEMLLLKGHLIVERLLVAAVARRLGCDEIAVPRLSFATLIDFVLTDDDERRRTIWFNDLRNSLAHEFDALENAEFRAIIARFKLPWPSGPLERCIVLEHVVYLIGHLVDRRGLEYEFASGRWEKHPEMLEVLEQSKAVSNEILNRVEHSFEEIRRESWDDLVRNHRPGWRTP
jgi:hypothetical protein